MNRFRQLLTISIILAIVAGSFGWAYWPTINRLVTAWNTQPDYSHGFLVVPAAILFLWARRDTFPGMSGRPCWSGLAWIALSISIRMLSARYYIDAVDGWSILVWVAGVVWLLAGPKVVWWSLPSIAFLWFMVPMPFRLDHALSRPLRAVATQASCWVLQCFGQPALSENYTIFLGGLRLEVEQACSGLRVFMGISALAFVYVVLVRRSWWERALVIASIVPVALVANITRIVATGLLMQSFSGSHAHELTHDWAGYLMIPYAAILFAGVLWYLRHLLPVMEEVDIGDIARHRRHEI